MHRLAVLGLLLVLPPPILAGCAPDGPETLSVRGQVYRFPAERWIATGNGENRSTKYAQIEPPGRAYDLSYDELDDMKAPDARGLPHIAWVHDPGVPREYSYTSTPHGIVVCNQNSVREKRGLQCGMSIYDQGVRWQLRFQHAEVGRAAAMAEDALELLRSYRTAARTSRARDEPR